MRYMLFMRTTLSIDDDVMLAARAIADQRGASIGAVISELARASLDKPASSATRNGIELLPISNPGAVVTLEIVNALRDDLM